MASPTSHIWFDGELVPWDDARVHVLSHGLHYGSGAFEGIRVYSTEDGPAAFRLGDHMRRLVRSARAFRLPLEWSPDDLTKAALEVVRSVGLESCYVRPLVFYGTGSMGLNPAGASLHTVIAAWELGAYLGEEGLARGVRARVSSWRRIGHDALIPNAKGTGQYLNSVLAKQEALAAGYDEGIFLSDTGHLVEGTGENIFLVSGGVVRTPDPGVGALPGITRESVMTLLRDHDIEVEESSLTRSDLYAADEAFFTGTAAEVTPIREIDDRPLAAPGPITKRAQELYMSAVRGELDGYRRWLDFA